MHICRSEYVFAILFGSFLIVSTMSAMAETTILDNQSIDPSMLKLPLSFIENQGQSTEDVRFMVQTGGQIVLLAPSEVVFKLSRGNNSSSVHMAFENCSPVQIMGKSSFLARPTSSSAMILPAGSPISQPMGQSGIKSSILGWIWSSGEQMGT